MTGMRGSGRGEGSTEKEAGGGDDSGTLDLTENVGAYQAMAQIGIWTPAVPGPFYLLMRKGTCTIRA